MPQVGSKDAVLLLPLKLLDNRAFAMLLEWVRVNPELLVAISSGNGADTRAAKPRNGERSCPVRLVKSLDPAEPEAIFFFF